MPLFGAAIESLKDQVAKHNAMVADLKKRLLEGVVEFTYKKSDGTVRHARGTMNPDLLPKSESGKKFKVTEIKRDDGGEAPKQATLFIPESDLKRFPAEADAVTDVLGKKLGCDFTGTYTCFEVSAEEKRKLPAGTVFYYDLDKHEFRSFKEDRLILEDK